jgi:hypothetical protein
MRKLPEEYAVWAREAFAYDPVTGVITWKTEVKGKHKVGDRAGYITDRGYRKMAVCGQKILASHIAWLLTYGEWPAKEVDHINRIRDDNRIENLRLANESQQRMNQKIASNSETGVTGVHYYTARVKQGLKPYQAYISLQYRRIHLGYFWALGEAKAVRAAAELKYFGDYAARKEVVNL